MTGLAQRLQQSSDPQPGPLKVWGWHRDADRSDSAGFELCDLVTLEKSISLFEPFSSSSRASQVAQW